MASSCELPGYLCLACDQSIGDPSPAAEKVVKALAELSGETVAPYGASAAILLGLTAKGPPAEVYLTSGRTRTLRLGRAEVLVKHAPTGCSHSAVARRGSDTRPSLMGPSQASRALAALRQQLPEPEWQALASSRAILPPGWPRQ